MRITTAIPTYNRAQDLAITLRSLEFVSIPSTVRHSIIVVDNNSVDETKSVVKRFSAEGRIDVRYVLETKQGLCHARNRAVTESDCEVLAFLDDDVDVDRRWLSALEVAYESGEAAAVGGKAFLVYPFNRPRWLSDCDEGLLSKVDLGPDRRPAAPDDIFGLNLSIRKTWFDRVGMFRTDLDRVGGCLLSGGETELLQRIAVAGGTLLYEPAAVVGHRVPMERLKRRWFWSRAYWGGLSTARMLPQTEIGYYFGTRAAWHTAKSCQVAAAAFLRHGVRSPEFFQASKAVTARYGITVGLAARQLAGSKTV